MNHDNDQADVRTLDAFRRNAIRDAYRGHASWDKAFDVALRRSWSKTNAKAIADLAFPRKQRSKR